MRYRFPVIAVLVCITAPSFGATLNVPGTYGSIQEAVDAASAGDTIMIAPGVYNEHDIDPGAKDLILRGANAASTVIDAQRLGAILLLKDGQTLSTLVTDLTFRNGLSDTNPAFGGAIGIADNSAATIRNNIFENNEALVGGNGSGGAIKVTDGSNAVIEDNTFEGNRAYLQGGAIHVIRSQATIRRNQFYHNEVDGGPEPGGGAVKATLASGPVIVANNHFEGNRASFAGGGISAFAADATISGNMFRDNGDCRFGGAVHLETQVNNGGDRTFVVTSNIFINNHATNRPDPELDPEDDLVRGGCIHYFGEGTNSSVTITQNIFRGNTARDARCPPGDFISNPFCAQGGCISTIRGTGPMLIANNTIESSESDLYAALIVDKGPAEIHDNLIMGNRALYNYSGAACVETDSCDVYNNVFTRNRTRTPNSGLRNPGGIYVLNTNANIRNNFFLENEGSLASAIYGANAGFSTLVVNNTFAANTSQNLGGAHIRLDGAGVLQNNIFSGDHRGVRVDSGSGVTYLRNYFFANTRSLALIGGDEKVTAQELNQLGPAASGNRSRNPLFLAPHEGNYNLDPSSTLIDAITCADAPATDYEGEPRPQGAQCDVGADEVDPTTSRTRRFAQGVGSNFPAGSQAGNSITVFGNTVFIGAPEDNTTAKGLPGAPGALYQYRRVGNQLVFVDKIVAPPGFDASNFGASSGFDGETLVVGAPGDPTKSQLAKGQPTLQAAIFSRLSNGGFMFSKPADTGAAGVASAFGASVAVSGESMAIGAPQAGTSGQVNVYRFQSSGGFNLATQATPPASAGPGSGFGTAVDIKKGVMAAGAPSWLVNNAVTGAVSMYQVVGTNLNPVATLNGSGNNGGDQFGTSVALSGNIMAVGAPGEVGGTNESEGAAYVFDISGGSRIMEVAALKPGDPVDGGAFGHSVAIDNGSIAVGSPGALGTNFQPTGAAYVYDPRNLRYSQALKLQFSQGAADDRIGTAVGYSQGNLLLGAPMLNGTGGAILFADPAAIFRSSFEDN